MMNDNPAMEWYHHHHQQQQQQQQQQQHNHPNGNYRNVELGGYWSLPTHIKPTTMEMVSSLSHSQLLTILEQLIQVIGLHLMKQEETVSTSKEREQLQRRSQLQPIIAICIPEGPYLPITMLAVHILNAIAVENDDGVNYYAAPVILPLDPQEGVDRLKHMMKDAKPCFILYVKNTLDGKKIEEVIQSLSESTSDGETKTKPPQMLDIITLLESEPISSSSISIQLLLAKNHIIRFNRISHIVYTSGTTGKPKGTISSINSLLNYIHAKNRSHNISCKSKVFLGSSLSFDPCLSDIIATFYSGGCLCLCSKERMKMELGPILNALNVTHILCTPSLWNSVNMIQIADDCENDENKNEKDDCQSLNCLEVVALGGEVMSGRIKGCWARTRRKDSSSTIAQGENKVSEQNKNGGVQLLSTYGVTEACVYQTVGEVFIEDIVAKSAGYDVGLPMDGMNISIWKEIQNETTTDQESTLIGVDAMTEEEGEIVLSGNQLDEYSGYLNLPELTKKKFICIASETNNGAVKYFYRTGDRGLINTNSGHLHILGRIDGEEGMIKISGVRVELGEIEHAILDSVSFTNCANCRPLVIACVIVVNTVNDEGSKKIVAYCVLSDDCMAELGIKDNDEGLICTPGPLLALLRARCEKTVRKECIPSTFVLIPRIPLTRTGKCDRKALPILESCQLIDTFINGPDDNVSIRLDKYGRCGHFVYKILIDCLNLQSKQQEIVTTKANFAMLGGDSLGATLVVRSLYAIHHQVNNTRNLGGAFGSFDGPFNVSHLLRSATLGEYVDFLDSSKVIDKVGTVEVDRGLNDEDTVNRINNNNDNGDLFLYESLVEAITIGHSIIAGGLISVGTKPNYGEHGRRLGKLKNGRKEQKQLLKSNPLHLACVKGDYDLVATLIRSGCNCKSPDANGNYPLHLACSGLGNAINNCDSASDDKEDKKRLKCVRLLLEAGVPLAMKNASKQTVLHSAARAGHCRLLIFLMKAWGDEETIKANKLWGSKYDWQDRWFRTPVHWAVLNGKVSALKLLLEHCSPNPPLPRNSLKRSTVAVENPLEICERLYDIDNGIGKEIKSLLLNGR